MLSIKYFIIALMGTLALSSAHAISVVNQGNEDITFTIGYLREGEDKCTLAKQFMGFEMWQVPHNYTIRTDYTTPFNIKKKLCVIAEIRAGSGYTDSSPVTNHDDCQLIYRDKDNFEYSQECSD